MTSQRYLVASAAFGALSLIALTFGAGLGFFALLVVLAAAVVAVGIVVERRVVARVQVETDAEFVCGADRGSASDVSGFDMRPIRFRKHGYMVISDRGLTFSLRQGGVLAQAPWAEIDGVRLRAFGLRRSGRFICVAQRSGALDFRVPNGEELEAALRARLDPARIAPLDIA